MVAVSDGTCRLYTIHMKMGINLTIEDRVRGWKMNIDDDNMTAGAKWCTVTGAKEGNQGHVQNRDEGLTGTIENTGKKKKRATAFRTDTWIVTGNP